MFHSPASATLLQLRPPRKLVQQRASLHHRHSGADERPRKGRINNVLPPQDTRGEGGKTLNEKKSFLFLMAVSVAVMMPTIGTSSGITAKFRSLANTSSSVCVSFLFERGIKEAIHFKLKKTSLNQRGGLRHFLSPTYHAVLHSLNSRNSKHSHLLTRPVDSPTDKGEGSQQKLGEQPCQRLSGDHSGH